MQHGRESRVEEHRFTGLLPGLNDEFLFALIFPSSYASKTVPVALAEFIGRHSVNWGMLVTGGFIASLPPIMLSFVGYRYLVSGLSAGGLKG